MHQEELEELNREFISGIEKGRHFQWLACESGNRRQKKSLPIKRRWRNGQWSDVMGIDAGIYSTWILTKLPYFAYDKSKCSALAFFCVLFAGFGLGFAIAVAIFKLILARKMHNCPTKAKPTAQPHTSVSHPSSISKSKR